MAHLQRDDRQQLARMTAALPGALEHLIREVTEQNLRLPRAAKPFLEGEIRLLDTLQHQVIPEMLGRLR
jgi:hypothetical protein